MNRSHFAVAALAVVCLLTTSMTYAANSGPPGNCPAGRMLDPNTGTCVNAPAGMTGVCPHTRIANGNGGCSPTQTSDCRAGRMFDPNTGTCVNAPAGSTTGCPSGQVANGQGGCLPTQTSNCPAGRIFNSNTGTCVNAPAGSTTGCPTGQIANGNGGCIMTQSSSCPAGRVFDPTRGVCVNAAAGATGVCPSGQIANGNGGCIVGQAPTCPVGRMLDPNTGTCVNAPAGSTGVCPNGQVANGQGGCLPTQTSNCPAGRMFDPNTGTCVSAPAGSTGVCPNGQIANGSGGCLAPQTSGCPTGQIRDVNTGVCSFPPAGSTGVCPNGQVANGHGGCLPTQTSNCPAGRIFNPNTGTCVNAPAGSTTGCPTGQIANGNGGCLMTQSGSCPTGQTFNPNTGTCSFPPAGSTGTCPNGQIANGSGGCLPTQTSGCPTGQIRDVNTGVCSFPPAGSTGVCPNGQVANGSGGCVGAQAAAPVLQVLPMAPLQSVQAAPVQLTPAGSPLLQPGPQVLQAAPARNLTTPLPAPVAQVGGRVSPLATQAAPAPQNVHVLPGATPMLHTLVWDRLEGISGYNVYANNNATKGTWMLANAAPLTTESFTDTAFLQPGAQYRVTALYPNEQQSSTDFLYANPPQMEVPAGFTATQIGAGQVRLSWQPVNLAKGYRVFGSGQPPDGTFVAATQLVLSNIPNGNYSWQLTADYGGAWQGAGLPVASITLASAAAASGHYLVTIAGVRAIWASVDDQLSRDGQGDEIYAKAFVRQYDRRTGDVVMFTNRGTLTYGDINGRGTSRVQAGTQSASGGIRDGDAIPANGDPTDRNGNPSDIAFPLRLWEGTLTDGVDALVISPTLWEEDNSNQPYQLWSQQMNDITPSLLPRPEIQDQIAKGGFTPILFGSSALTGTSGTAQLAASTTGLSAAFADPTGISLAIATFQIGGAILAGDSDRPIGLIPTGVANVNVALPNQMVVLTREVIEAALVPLPRGTPAIGPPFWPRVPKPGVMMIMCRDGEHRNAMQQLERPASYEMYLKVERLP